jgi:hypothetical protein
MCLPQPRSNLVGRGINLPSLDRTAPGRGGYHEYYAHESHNDAQLDYAKAVLVF